MITLYFHWTIMMSMIKWMLWTFLDVHIWTMMAPPPIMLSTEAQMALAWTCYILRTIQYFFHHHLDGNGVSHMVSRHLQAKKHSCDLPKPMTPSIGSAWHLDSNQHCSGPRCDQLTL